MTEQEWLESVDLVAMLDWLMENHKPSDRKLRLFVCAMAIASPSHSRLDNDGEAISSYWDTRAFAWCRHVIRHKDIALPELARILRNIVGNPWRPVTLPLGEKCSLCKGRGRILYDKRSREPAIYRAARGRSHSSTNDLTEVECERCHGTGHRPSPVLTPLVLSIAQAAYDERQENGTLDNATLAILADALEDAGLPECVKCTSCNGVGTVTIWTAEASCDNCCDSHCVEEGGYWKGSGTMLNPLLAALRAPGPHYPGFWALDVVLGRA
mgnify:CR=1 FL=1